MSSAAATTTASSSAGARGLPRRSAARGPPTNCCSSTPAALHRRSAPPAAPEATATRSRATASTHSAHPAHLASQLSNGSSAIYQTGSTHASTQEHDPDRAFQLAQAAAQQALQLALQRSHHSCKPKQAAAAMQHMLQLAAAAGTPSRDAALLFTACVAPLLASGALSPLDTTHLMGQGAAAQAQDFCFLLKAVAKAAGNPCDLSGWCMEAGHPQAVLVFALWLLAGTGCSDALLSSAAAGLGSAPAQATELARQLLRRLGVALSPSLHAVLDALPEGGSRAHVAGAQDCSNGTTLEGRAGSAPGFKFGSDARSVLVSSSGGGSGAWYGSRTTPRVFCSSVQMKATDHSEGVVTLLGEGEEQQWEAEAGSQHRSRETNGAGSAHNGAAGPSHGGRRSDGAVSEATAADAAAQGRWAAAAAAAGTSVLSKAGQRDAGLRAGGAGGRAQGQGQVPGSYQGSVLSPQGRARLRRPTHLTQEEEVVDPSTPMGPSDLELGPMPPSRGWRSPAAREPARQEQVGEELGEEEGERQWRPKKLLHPGHDRPPAPALKLLLDGPLSANVSPYRLQMPEMGPWVVSNCRNAFPHSDVVLPLRSRRPDAGAAALQAWERKWQGAKLALRFEFVADRRTAGAPPVLHVFNLSRVLAGRKRNCWAYVNGAPLAPGDRGVALAPGDVVVIGADPQKPLDGQRGTLRLVVQELDASQPTKSPIERALDWYGLSKTAAKAAGSGSGAAAGGPPQDAAAAVRKLKADVARDPTNTSAWMTLAQLSARDNRAFTTTRDLFRAALQSVDEFAAAADRQQEHAVAQAVAQGVAQQPDAAASSARHTQASAAAAPPQSHVRLPGSSTTAAASTDALAPPPSLPRAPVLPPPPPSPEPPSPAMGPSSSLASGWPLVRRKVQVLYHWAAAEWAGGSRGSARHLWRYAADLTYRHPLGAGNGGHWRVMLAWAQAELDRDAVTYARVILAEALRRTPAAQPLYVLGGAIELAAGNLKLAKGFCARAYELDRQDERLYGVWPKVEAALGQRDRARVLFERGLEYHPHSLSLLEEYARFESQYGDVHQARELHRRALELDPEGIQSLSIRASYATLELEQGRLPIARRLLQEGRALGPEAASHSELLLAEARLERLSGNLEVARRLLESVDKRRGFFRTDVLQERVLLLRAYGEAELARSLEAHLRASLRLQQAKRQGAPAWKAWREFFADAGSPERQELLAAARARKTELGLWGVRDGSRGQGGAVNGGDPVNGILGGPAGAAGVADGFLSAAAAASGLEGTAGDQEHAVSAGLAASQQQEQQWVAAEAEEEEEEEEEEAVDVPAVVGPLRRPRIPEELMRQERAVRERIWRDRRERQEQRERERAAALARVQEGGEGEEEEEGGEGEEEEEEDVLGYEEEARGGLGLPEVAWEEVEGAMAAAEADEREELRVRQQQERREAQLVVLEEGERGEEEEEGERGKGLANGHNVARSRRQQQWQSVGLGSEQRG